MDFPKLSTLAQRVMWARKRKGWSQEELADRTPGSTRAQLQKIENAITLRPRNMDELAKTLEVPPAWLQFGHEELSNLSDAAIQLAVDWESLSPETQRAIQAAVEAAKK